MHSLIIIFFDERFNLIQCLWFRSQLHKRSIIPVLNPINQRNNGWIIDQQLLHFIILHCLLKYFLCFLWICHQISHHITSIPAIIFIIFIPIVITAKIWHSSAAAAAHLSHHLLHILHCIRIRHHLLSHLLHHWILH